MTKTFSNSGTRGCPTRQAGAPRNPLTTHSDKLDRLAASTDNGGLGSGAELARLGDDGSDDADDANTSGAHTYHALFLTGRNPRCDTDGFTGPSNTFSSGDTTV